MFSVSFRNPERPDMDHIAGEQCIAEANDFLFYNGTNSDKPVAVVPRDVVLAIRQEDEPEEQPSRDACETTRVVQGPRGAVEPDVARELAKVHQNIIVDLMRRDPMTIERITVTRETAVGPLGERGCATSVLTGRTNYTIRVFDANEPGKPCP